MISREKVLEQLPQSKEDWVLITEDQDVNDIIKQVLKAHEANSALYDKIALYFDAPTVYEICNGIYDFEKAYIRYREEPVTAQTTAVPQGILERGYGDCKHYASFAGGVLDALKRQGKKIDWQYKFVSYAIYKPVPYHVFVSVRDKGKEYWIDPTPGAVGKQPVWEINRKPKSSMPLYNQVAGIDGGASVGNFFDDAFKGIQHFAAGMGMQVPRAAFLGLVEINAFGYANKLYKALQYPDIKAKLADLWERAGGKFSVLESAINHGETLPPNTNAETTHTTDADLAAQGIYRDDNGVLRYNTVAGAKIGFEPTITASIVASAAIMVAAIMPVISKLLDHKNANVNTGIQLDPNTGLPVGVPVSTNPLLDFVRSNPILVAVVGLGIAYYLYEQQ